MALTCGRKSFHQEEPTNEGSPSGFELIEQKQDEDREGQLLRVESPSISLILPLQDSPFFNGPGNQASI